MAYKQISPQNVVEGGTGATTLTGVLTGNGTSALTGNAVTQYRVLLGGASNAVSEAAGVGTSGQVLTSNGAGSNPTFQNNDSGTWVFLGSQTASTSATLDFTGLDSTYPAHVFIIDRLITDSGSSSQFRVLFSVDNGSNYLSTGYAGASLNISYTSTTWNSTNATTYIPVTGGEVNSYVGASGQIFAYGLGTSSEPTIVGQLIWKVTSTPGCALSECLGTNNTTDGVNAVRFLHGVGNIESGSIYLYGINPS